MPVKHSYIYLGNLTQLVVVRVLNHFKSDSEVTLKTYYAFRTGGVLAALMAIVILIPRLGIAQDYQFVSIQNLIEQEVGRVLIPEIYKKLDLTVDISPMPGNRAQEEATTGAKDGEIMRIFTYGNENPTTIRVPTPYYYLETMGFVRKNSGIRIKSKADLAKYRLAKVRGVKHTNNITKGLENVFDLKNTETMMEFLARGRADVALTNTVDGLLVLEKLGYENIGPIEKPLAVLDLYNYIHENHADIVPLVDKAILDMQSSGELKQLIAKAEAVVIQSLK